MNLGSCLICTTRFIPSKVSALPCGHLFHYECVIQWVQKEKNCPTCRRRCIESNIIKKLFIESDDSNSQISTEEEIDIVKMELHKKKEECLELMNEKTRIDIELAKTQRQVKRWKNSAEEGTDAIKKMNQLKLMLADQNTKEREIKVLKDRLKACKFYDLITKGNGEEIDKYLGNGEVETSMFLQQLRQQLDSSNKKLKEEQRKYTEMKNRCIEYKKMIQEIQKEQNGEESSSKGLLGRLNANKKDKERLSFGRVDESILFSESILKSAVRPIPKGKIRIDKENVFEDEECIPSTSSNSDILTDLSPISYYDNDISLPKSMKSRISHKEKTSNGMGSTFSSKNPFDRLDTLASRDKVRCAPYPKPLGQKKLVLMKNTRLDNFFDKVVVSKKKNDIMDINDDVIELE